MTHVLPSSKAEPKEPNRALVPVHDDIKLIHGGTKGCDHGGRRSCRLGSGTDRFAVLAVRAESPWWSVHLSHTVLVMTTASTVTEKSSTAHPHGGSRDVIDGNEAAARIAHLASEVIAIYPITPASPMGEFADDWSAKGRTNLWGAVPEVIEMQSEAGAAGTLHGAVTRGALGTTFTASQGLLLMLPNMFKIAGELTPTVIHVAARTVATHALSIFGDHSDVMAARTTGFAMLCASSVQETADFAAVAHATTLETRIPFLHFFDGFRTSHELGTIEVPTADDLSAMIDPADVAAHRARGLDPDRPVLRGSAAEPRCLLPGPRGVQPVLRRRTRGGAGVDGPSGRRSPGGSTTWSTTTVRRTPTGSSC